MKHYPIILSLLVMAMLSASCGRARISAPAPIISINSLATGIRGIVTFENLTSHPLEVTVDGKMLVLPAAANATFPDLPSTGTARSDYTISQSGTILASGSVQTSPSGTDCTIR